jgi:hypothetical protein
MDEIPEHLLRGCNLVNVFFRLPLNHSDIVVSMGASDICILSRLYIELFEVKRGMNVGLPIRTDAILGLE